MYRRTPLSLALICAFGAPGPALAQDADTQTITITAQGRTQTLSPGDLLWLEDGVSHSLIALTDASLLVTILLHRT